MEFLVPGEESNGDEEESELSLWLLLLFGSIRLLFRLRLSHFFVDFARDSQFMEDELKSCPSVSELNNGEMK